VLGTFRIEELVFPVTGLRLARGAIMARVTIEITADNHAQLSAAGAGAKVMLFGDDGSLVVRGRYGEDWPNLGRYKVGDTLALTYVLDVPRRLTQDMASGES
jgi:hypothetical protein